MPVVQNTAKDPGGNPLYPANVTITLIAAPGGHATGYTGAGTILSTYTTVTDKTGRWTATLTGNADVTPANTYYLVSEAGWDSPIVVPTSGGPYDMPSLVVTPPTPSPVGITGVQVAADGTVAGNRPEINVVAGTNVTVSATDNPGANRVDVTVNSTGGSGGTPSNTVVTETSYGQAPTAGSATAYSRGDHTHGTPASPTASLRIVTTGFVTSGDITVAAGGFVQIGPDMTIAAAVGDILEFTPDLLVNNVGGDLQFEAATRSPVPADVNYWSSGTNTSRWPFGLGTWYVPTGFFSPGVARYVVQAGDIFDGEVTVRFYAQIPSASRTVFASSYPLRCWLTNLGPG